MVSQSHFRSYSQVSDHISSNKDFFSSLTYSSLLLTITLANGFQTIARGIGSACPLPSLPLTSVRYVLDFPFNIISISKLTRDLHCVLAFSHNFTEAHLLIHSRVGYPSLSKFGKLVTHFSSLSSLECESCQLGKHTRVSFPKR